jgi:hypothetical protein
MLGLNTKLLYLNHDALEGMPMVLLKYSGNTAHPRCSMWWPAGYGLPEANG